MGRSERMRSVEATRTIWQTQEKVTRSELLVLQALASHANEDLECYPSLGRLATMTKISKRQVIRILHGLREKGHVAFEENRGGRQKCNHYRLIIAAKGDKKSDTNGDITNGDTPKNGDILNTERVTACAETVANSHVNGDIAMSPEGFEWLEGVKSESGQKLPPPVFRNHDEVLNDLRNNPEELLENILRKGIPITRDEVCDGHWSDHRAHGPFIRHGWLWGNWIVWAGSKNFYSSGFRSAGCAGCQLDEDEWKARDPKHYALYNSQIFTLKSPAICDRHGKFIFDASIQVYTEEYASVGLDRYQVSEEICSKCDSEITEEAYLQDDLGLSNEEMKRGCEPVLAALHYARGYIDNSQYLVVLQDVIIPGLKEKRVAERASPSPVLQDVTM